MYMYIPRTYISKIYIYTLGIYIYINTQIIYFQNLPQILTLYSHTM